MIERIVQVSIKTRKRIRNKYNGGGERKMNVSAAIRTKRAVRKFQDRPLPEEAIEAILYAGRRAQSSKNTQPWHFIAIQDRSALQALSETGTYAGHLAGAALGIAILTPDPAQRFSILFDAGQSAAYMQLAAWELGIGSCLATIYEPEKARQILGFPAELHLRIAISFGYPLDESVLSAPPRQGGRRELEEVAHWEQW
jgi:nitroreductase